MVRPVRDSVHILQHNTAVIISLYAGRNIDPDEYFELLNNTVTTYIRELANPAAICLCVDGPGAAVEVAAKLEQRYGVTLVLAERNGGKFAAVQNGMQRMLTETDFTYFAAVDQDGDHFANDLLDFVRTAEHVRSHIDTERILVMGERLSLHRPLGYLRGEQETLADALLFDALQYHAAITGRPLNLTFAQFIHKHPDFHAGYKLFSRQSAVDVFTTPPDFAGCGEEAYYRHAIEAVMVVEALTRGATLASLTRRTYDEQPVSVFADFNLTQLTANLIIWPCKRLGIPREFVKQWLANHLPELMLGTLQPTGRDELLAIQKLVLEAFDYPPNESARSEIDRPRFV